MSILNRTINKLHFEDLDPHRFEDLVYDILFRNKSWNIIENWGKSGSDGGVDIYCEDSTGQKWFCQCKRYKSISLKQTKSVVDKIINGNKNTNDCIILLVVACDISKTTSEEFKKYSKDKGFKDAEIWSSIRLEAELYNKHTDLIEKYFGYSNNKGEKEKRIIDSVKMRKEVESKLINNDILQNPQYWQKIIKDPSLKFVCDAVIVHSIDDNLYPGGGEKDEAVTSWFKIWFYNLTFDGIEFLLAPYEYVKVAVDLQTKYWRKLKENEKPFGNEIVMDADYIGLIPYYNIVCINEDGDEFYQEPHVYCRFSFDNYPYSKYYLKNRTKQIDFFEGMPIDELQFARLIPSGSKMVLMNNKLV